MSGKDLKIINMNSSANLHDNYWIKERKLHFNDYERNKSIAHLFSQNESVLDVGCGDGAVAEFLKKHYQSKVIGLDFSVTALKKAHSRGISVILADVEKSLPINSNSIDLVFFGDVVEHIYSPDTALQEIHRVLKPGGKLIVSCPNMGYWRYRLYYLIHGIFPETEWIEDELWQSQHIRFFNKSLLFRLLKMNKFSPIEFIGVSRRRFDKPLLELFPNLFGMIMVVVATKS